MHKKNQILQWIIRLLGLGIAGFATYVAVCGIVDKPTLLVCLCELGSIALTLIIFTILLHLCCLSCRHPHHHGDRHGNYRNRDKFRRDKRDFKFRDKASNDIKEDVEVSSASDNSADGNDNSVVDKYL